MYVIISFVLCLLGSGFLRVVSFILSFVRLLYVYCTFICILVRSFGFDFWWLCGLLVNGPEATNCELWMGGACCFHSFVYRIKSHTSKQTNYSSVGYR